MVHPRTGAVLRNPECGAGARGAHGAPAFKKEPAINEDGGFELLAIRLVGHKVRSRGLHSFRTQNGREFALCALLCLAETVFQADVAISRPLLRGVCRRCEAPLNCLAPEVGGSLKDRCLK